MSQLEAAAALVFQAGADEHPCPVLMLPPGLLGIGVARRLHTASWLHREHTALAQGLGSQSSSKQPAAKVLAAEC